MADSGGVSPGGPRISSAKRKRCVRKHPCNQGAPPPFTAAPACPLVPAGWQRLSNKHAAQLPAAGLAWDAPAAADHSDKAANRAAT